MTKEEMQKFHDWVSGDDRLRMILEGKFRLDQKMTDEQAAECAKQVVATLRAELQIRMAEKV